MENNIENIENVEIKDIARDAILQTSVRGTQDEKQRQTTAAVLAASIELNGLLQPIVIRKLSSVERSRSKTTATYGIVSGRIRYDATVLLGKSEIRAMVYEEKLEREDAKAATVNLSVSKVSEMDKCKVIRAMRDNYRKTADGKLVSINDCITRGIPKDKVKVLTDNEVAALLGISRSYVSKLSKLERSNGDYEFKLIGSDGKFKLDNLTTLYREFSDTYKFLVTADATHGDELTDKLKTLTNFRTELNKLIDDVKNIYGYSAASVINETERVADAAENSITKSLEINNEDQPKVEALDQANADNGESKLAEEKDELDLKMESLGLQLAEQTAGEQQYPTSANDANWDVFSEKSA